MSFADLEQSSATQYYYDLKSQLPREVARRSEAAFAAGDAARDAIKLPAELEARQDYIRKSFIDSIGSLPPSDTPLNATLMGKIEEPGLVIEKIIYESRPGARVTANLYLPRDIQFPAPAVLFVCGHHEMAKHAPEYQVVCRHLAAAGLIVLAQDPIGQGERFSYYEDSLKGTTVGWGTREHDYAGAQCALLGDSIARYFVHDAMRGIDYLCSRPEVDSKRIGITGNSGGGTQSSMMMMADPRLAAAAPGTFVMNRRTYMYTGGAQDAEQIWCGWSAKGLDHEDFILAMCPKPVCVLSVKYDFFPIEGTRETVARCRRFYEMAKRPDALELVEDVSTHCYTPMLARSAARFFSRHLGGKAVDVDSSTIQALEPDKLWCTISGQLRGDFGGQRAAYEENQLRLDEFQKNAPSKDRFLAFLREKVTNGRSKSDVNPRVFFKTTNDELQVELAFWQSWKGMMNEGMLFRHSRFDGQNLPCTVALWEGGQSNLVAHAEWIRSICESGRAVLVASLTGMGHSIPNAFNATPPRAPYGSLHKLNDDLMFLGDSLAAMRTYDLGCIPELLGNWPGIDVSLPLQVETWGYYNIYVRLAAMLDSRLLVAETHRPLAAFADWLQARHYEVTDSRVFLFPGILRYGDLA